ncbi:MAG TPA: cytochrome C [Anaerolineae bacterium]|nr:cytochrome C [Anaerolineae bacterium]
MNIYPESAMRRQFLKQPIFWLPVVGLILLFLAAAGFTVQNVAAAPNPQREPPSDESCLFCHQQEGMTIDIGEQPLSLTVSGDHFSTSVHGVEGVACVDCHTNIRTVPHPEIIADNSREFTLTFYETCRQCHSEQYEKTFDSVHQTAIVDGNLNAAVCSDCHDPHSQPRITDETTGVILSDARQDIPQTCAQCHGAVFEAYAASVHGATLFTEGNADVPTCTDCHGVHSIEDPNTNTFHNSIPSVCADCHTDEVMMSKYGLNTNVLDTYVADFHGTTVKLFEEQFPDQPTNKAVCTDCHGFHDIPKVDDPAAGIAHKSNLLVKCQQCHPDATTESFTASWMSHYEPSPETWPLVYYVNLFYKFFIPTVLGGMIVFVLSDIYRRFIVDKRHKKNGKDASTK